MPLSLDAGIITEVIPIDEALIIHVIIAYCANAMAFQHICLEFFCFLHQQLAVLLAHVDGPGVLELVVMSSFKKILDFVVVVQAFHAVITILSLSDRRVGLGIHKLLLASFVQCLGVNVHSLEEILLFLLSERLQDLFYHLN